MVGEDWQLLRRCLTRLLAVLVERRGVEEMAIFANHHHRWATTLYPIRSSVSFRSPRPIGYLTLVAYNAHLLPSSSTANPHPLSLSTPDQSCKQTRRCSRPGINHMSSDDHNTKLYASLQHQVSLIATATLSTSGRAPTRLTKDALKTLTKVRGDLPANDHAGSSVAHLSLVGSSSLVHNTSGF